MNKQTSLLVRIDAMLVFVDLKVMLLAWILIDLYRNTILLSDISGRKSMKAAAVLQYVWETCGSPYLIWIPIVAVADIFVKRIVKAGIE